MMKFDVHKILPCVIRSEAGIVLSLFLIFDDFDSPCSYKIVLMKKVICCYKLFFAARAQLRCRPKRILFILGC